MPVQPEADVGEVGFEAVLQVAAQLQIARVFGRLAADQAQLRGGDGVACALLRRGVQKVFHRLAVFVEFDDALEHYDHALDLARANLKAAPNDAQARADLAGALTNVGDVYDEHGRLEPAIQAHEESLQIRRALAAEAPADKGALRGLSLGLERLADTREARGHRSRALGLYQESLPIAQRLAADHPDEPLYTKDLETTQARVDELTREMAPPVLEPVED